MKLNVLALVPAEMNCSGLFYDHIHTVNAHTNKKIGGYHSINTRQSSIVVFHDIDFFHKGRTYFQVGNFSNLLFSSIFQYLQFSTFIQLRILNDTKASEPICQCPLYRNMYISDLYGTRKEQ